MRFIKYRALSLLTFWLLIIAETSGQAIQSIGVPYVENYSKSKYLAGNQNWSGTIDEHQIMYFGNSQGLLSFNGTSWNLHKMPHNLIVRSVAADKKGRIYTGAFGEMGYWSHNSKAILEYHSLIHLLPADFKLRDEIWKIYIDGERVIFQSFGAILIFQDNKFKVIREGPYLFLFKAGKRFFVQLLRKGLFELKSNDLHSIPGNELLANASVLSVLPFNSKQFLIGTSNNGLYLYDGNRISPWQVPANNFLKIYQLNNGIRLFGKYFAFGTILNGVIIVDSSGNIIQHINKSSGLQNNTVLSLYTDEFQNLWAGLDNGIDRIELNSPLSFFFDKTGAFGTVYSSIIFKNRIYLGTNQGLFSSVWDPLMQRQIFDFKLISNSQGQVWDLTTIDGELFCGHNSGTFKVKGTTIDKISSVSGGWTVKKLNLQPDKLIQGTYTGIVVYQKSLDGKYSFSHKVQGFEAPARYVEQDPRGNIWVSHAYKGVYKINLKQGLRSVNTIRTYDEKSGLPTDYSINIFNLDGRIVFSSMKGFFVYDDIADRFRPYEELNKRLGSFSVSNKIIKADERAYWFIDHGKVARVDFSEPGKLKIDSALFSILNGRMVQDYENISRINENLSLISIDDGFALFNRLLKPQKQKIPAVFIGRVENITSSDSVITESGSLSGPLKVKYDRNNIRINYALPYYRQASITYQYFLKGYSVAWSPWDELSQKDFTNLPYGQYSFKVRAKINDGAVSETSTLEFEVLPPLTATLGAWILYIILFCISLYFIRILYFRKLKEHQLKIEKEVQQEKEDHLKQEAIINEQKLIKMKNEKLQAEIDSKSREVTNSAMNIVYKNDFLQRIKEELTQLKDGQGNKLNDEQLKRMHKIIDEGMNKERDWNLFESSFNETHESFFKKLKTRHPELVPNDLKLCAYLRMNMNSKEMASLLNISLRGVEIRRYRLRKKLAIPHDKNLVEFLIEL